MKMSFPTRLAAIDWIANNAKDETQFEVLREQLNYNFIYFQIYFIDMSELNEDIALLDFSPKKRKKK